MRRPSVVASILVAVSLLLSSTSQADDIDDFIRSERERQGVPGLAVLIVEDGSPTKMRGYGIANVEHQVPVEAHTIFQSGSMGKQFTAAGILLLCEDEKLKLDDPLSKHFSNVPGAWKRITVKHLLTHTSGIKDYEDKVDLRKDYTEDQLLKVMMALPVQFKPGSQWSYSNSGYVILGILISKLSGAHWSEFLEERVFKPAGMTTARVISESDIVPHRSAGYLRREKKLYNQDWVSPTFLSTGDGALYFSIKDLFAWDTALRHRKILSEEIYNAWWAPVKLSNGEFFPYGFGWGLNEQRGKPVIAHGGVWQGFRTYIARYVDDNLTIAVLANCQTARPNLIATEVAGLIRDHLALPSPDDPGDDPDPSRTLRIRSALEAWASSKSHESLAGGL